MTSASQARRVARRAVWLVVALAASALWAAVAYAFLGLAVDCENGVCQHHPVYLVAELALSLLGIVLLLYSPFARVRRGLVALGAATIVCVVWIVVTFAALGGSQ